MPRPAMSLRARLGVIAAAVAVFAGLQLAALAIYRKIERGRSAEGAGEPAFGVEPLAGDQRAPAFTATRRDGSAASIEWPARRVRIVHFWGTWCEPCRRELPSLLAFARATSGIEVIAVAVEDDWPSIDAFFHGGPVPPEVVMETGGAAAKRYGASLLPDSYLVDRAGLLVERFHGARAWESAAARDHLAPFAN